LTPCGILRDVRFIIVIISETVYIRWSDLLFTVTNT